MSPETISLIGGIIVAILTGVFVPIYLKKRDSDDVEDATAMKSWQDYAGAVLAERDQLKKDLAGIEARHREELREVEADFRRRLREAQDEIDQLRSDVTTLRRIIARDGGAVP